MSRLASLVAVGLRPPTSRLAFPLRKGRSWTSSPPQASEPLVRGTPPPDHRCPSRWCVAWCRSEESEYIHARDQLLGVGAAAVFMSYAAFVLAGEPAHEEAHPYYNAPYTFAKRSANTGAAWWPGRQCQLFEVSQTAQTNLASTHRRTYERSRRTIHDSLFCDPWQGQLRRRVGCGPSKTQGTSEDEQTSPSSHASGACAHASCLAMFPLFLVVQLLRQDLQGGGPDAPRDGEQAVKRFTAALQELRRERCS